MDKSKVMEEKKTGNLWERHKGAIIVVLIILALVLFIGGAFASTYNGAVMREEQINSAKASIETQEKRRVDLVRNLADTVKSYAKYESETLTKVTAERGSSNDGDIKEAKLAINAVAEAYPELKANENYKQFMTELTMTENRISEYRDNYNIQVRAYNKFVRSLGHRIALGIVGYEKIDYKYTEFGAPEDAPQKLLGE